MLILSNSIKKKKPENTLLSFSILIFWIKTIFPYQTILFIKSFNDNRNKKYIQKWLLSFMYRDSISCLSMPNYVLKMNITASFNYQKSTAVRTSIMNCLMDLSASGKSSLSFCFMILKLIYEGLKKQLALYSNQNMNIHQFLIFWKF